MRRMLAIGLGVFALAGGVASGANPPELDDVIAALHADPSQARRLFHLLLLRGRLVRIPDGKVFHARALDELKRRLWDQRARAPVIDISEFKELSGTSRKNAIPLLEHFDQTRVTRREGNKRLILPPPAAWRAAPAASPGPPPTRPASARPNRSRLCRNRAARCPCRRRAKYLPSPCPLPQGEEFLLPEGEG